MLEQVRERLATAAELSHEDLVTLHPLLKLENTSNVTGLQFVYPELSRHMKSNLTYAVAFTNSVLAKPANEIPQAIKEDLLRRVAQDMSTVSVDMRDHEAINSQLATLEQKRTAATDATEPQPLAKLSSPELGLFTKQLYGLGLFKPVESMLTRLRSEMNHVLILDLHRIYIPFLQELIGLMLMYGIPMRDVAYSNFFEGVLQNYFQRFVDQDVKDESIGHRSWRLRADAARTALESFDHTYFRNILGDRYKIVVLPGLTRLQSHSRGHGSSDGVTTSQSLSQ